MTFPDLTDPPDVFAPWAERVEMLYTSSVESQPVTIDWSEWAAANIDDYLDNLYEAARCDECGAIVTTRDADTHRWRLVLDEDATTDGAALPEWFDDEDDPQDWLDEHLIGDGNYTIERCGCEGDFAGDFGAEGPMMNYAYPVSHFDGSLDDAARKLVDLPLCLVEHPEHGTVLALTGGGMDLSWEVCEAFIAIGCLPSMHFTPPRDAARMTDARGLVLAACWKSRAVVAGWMARGADDIVRHATELTKGE